MNSGKEYSRQEVLNKLARFCSYRERSRAEVTKKLLSLGVSRNEVEGYIQFLEDENFINEERFCRVYVHSKLSYNNWGRHKLYAGLVSKGVDNKLISNSLNEIDAEEYKAALRKVLEKKSHEISSPDENVKRAKLIKYALSKGFTYEEITQQLKNIKL